MKKIYNVNYNLSSKDNTDYILLSDFHGYFDLKLANYISDIETKYVVISGDILEGFEWSNKIKLNDVMNFLHVIAVRHPVIVALGNHDLKRLTSEGFKNFKNLESIKNVYPIYNESITLDNDRFTNFLPNFKSFSYPKQESEETLEELLNTYDKVVHVDSTSKYIEHLVAHNPYHFNHEIIRHNISKYYDVIETGHFHDGWIPTKLLDKHYDDFLDKGIPEVLTKSVLLEKDSSLVVEPKRNLTRGVAYIFDDGYLVLLPNDKIYYYNYLLNEYSLKDKEYLDERLKKEKVPALVIGGAVNTFLRLNMFYPYITHITLNKNSSDYNANRLIKTK